jgi:hypothetical protein
VATRNTAMGLTYNVAAMISGAAPAVATAIVAQDANNGNRNGNQDNVMWVGIVTSCIAFVSVLGLCCGPTFSMRRLPRDNEKHSLVDVSEHRDRRIPSSTTSVLVTDQERQGEKARLLSSDV